MAIFPQFSPFLFLTGVLVPGIILIGLTLLFGRVFCGWICPLGCILEYTNLLFPKHLACISPGLKYYLLIGLVLCFPFLWHIEPLCLMQRLFCFILTPWRYTPYFIITIVTVIVILFFRRVWCQSLCPLGGLLSLLSRYKRVKRQVSSACTQCGRCQRICWMNLKQDDCLLCFRCQRNCPKGAVCFCFGKPAIEKIDVTRRGIIIAIASGIVSAIAIRLIPHSQDKYLIRPPGALPEDRFIATCVRCGACTKVCVSHGLIPDFLGTGLIGLGIPRLIPRIGACEDFCNLCGQVCPSGAIQRLTLDEKRKTRIGTAVINTEECIAYNEGKPCMVCNEQCLYNAINLDAKKRPVVNEKNCIGCGVCENKCPVYGEAAIRVVGRQGMSGLNFR
ncbi:MAG: 4Fe-4S binding protein [Candidatus Desantisbacteria bacterium]